MTPGGHGGGGGRGGRGGGQGRGGEGGQRPGSGGREPQQRERGQQRKPEPPRKPDAEPRKPEPQQHKPDRQPEPPRGGQGGGRGGRGQAGGGGQERGERGGGGRGGGQGRGGQGGGQRGGRPHDVSDISGTPSLDDLPGLSGQPRTPAASGGGGLGEIISGAAAAAASAIPGLGEALGTGAAHQASASPADAHKVASQHGGGTPAKFAAGTAIDVGATENKPELVETIPITTQPGAARQVVLSLGPDTDTDSPLPDLAAGDRIEVLAELELTTDAADPNHPGLIGNAYSYAPDVEANLLLAADASVTEVGPQAVELAPAWRQSISQERHHGVVTFGNGAVTIPAGGLPWGGGQARINLVVSASNAAAQSGDVLLVGQNEKTPVVVQDMSGIRTVRFRPGNTQAPAPLRQTTCLCGAIPVSKARTVVLSQELAGLAAGERLLIKARLATDATGLPAPARISTRLFIGDSPTQDEPGGAAQSAITWKGNLSKFTGFNCLPAEGPVVTEKYGVATVKQAPAGSLFVNLVAVSAAPFGGVAASQGLRIDPSQSVLEVTRLGGA